MTFKNKCRQWDKIGEVNLKENTKVYFRSVRM